MQGQTQKDNDSGIVRLQDNIVFWDYDGSNIFQIDVNEIVIIGEYTNSNGPWFDDWFIAFVTKDGQWHSIPFYAKNIDEVLRSLSDKFQMNLHATLANSTSWQSVIQYPLHLKGKTLFKLTPGGNYKAPKTFFDKILSAIGLGGFDTTKYINLTDEVKSELTNACH